MYASFYSIIQMPQIRWQVDIAISVANLHSFKFTRNVCTQACIYCMSSVLWYALILNAIRMPSYFCNFKYRSIPLFGYYKRGHKAPPQCDNSSLIFTIFIIVSLIRTTSVRSYSCVYNEAILIKTLLYRLCVIAHFTYSKILEGLLHIF